MNETWNNHNYTTSDFEQYVASHPNPKCTDYTKYIPFKEGMLLSYFDSDRSLNRFLDDDNYGKQRYNETPTDFVDEYKPIGTVFSFDVSDDGLIWSYSLRGNTSNVLNVPSTSNPYIDIFDRTFDDTYNQSYGYVEYSFLSIQTFIDNFNSITKYIAKINGGLDVNDIDDIYKGNVFMPFYTPQNDDFWPTMNVMFIFS